MAAIGEAEGRIAVGEVGDFARGNVKPSGVAPCLNARGGESLLAEPAEEALLLTLGEMDCLFCCCLEDERAVTGEVGDVGGEG